MPRRSVQTLADGAGIMYVFYDLYARQRTAMSLCTVQAREVAVTVSTRFIMCVLVIGLRLGLG